MRGVDLVQNSHNSMAQVYASIGGRRVICGEEKICWEFTSARRL